MIAVSPLMLMLVIIIVIEEEPIMSMIMITSMTESISRFGPLR
jgi:hypothetical protein